VWYQFDSESSRLRQDHGQDPKTQRTFHWLHQLWESVQFEMHATLISLQQVGLQALSTAASSLTPVSQTERVKLELECQEDEQRVKMCLKVTVGHAASSWTLPTSLYGAASAGWAAASAMSAYVPYVSKKVPPPPRIGEAAPEPALTQTSAVDEEGDREDRDLLLDMAEVLGSSSGQDPARDACDRQHTSMRLRFDKVPTCSEEEQLRRQGGACQECGSLQNGASYRMCFFTGGMFCGECLKTGQLSVIPARVVFDWDFVPRPVCSIAYDYLTSIKDQPMINITALNVSMLQKVPLLTDLTKTRRSILQNIARLQQELGGGEETTAIQALRREAGEKRAYLLQLEAQDFWSLAHLIEAAASASTIQQLSAYISASNSLTKWLSRVQVDTAAMCRAL
jgi:hypothetical protein